MRSKEFSPLEIINYYSRGEKLAFKGFYKYLCGMKNDDYIKFCRYYKGEKVNPFPPSLLFWVWEFERKWVEEELKASIKEEATDHLDYLLTEYRMAGLFDFQSGDGIPMSLRASIYALYLKGNELPTKEEFSKFYSKWLNKSI